MATDVVTGEAVVLDVHTAHLPSRILALLVDVTIQAALLAGVGVLAAGISRVVDPALTAAIGVVISGLVVVGYPAILESLWRGRTPGKTALGLRVVADNGGPERFRQALFRALAAVVEIWLLLGIPALVTSLASHQGRRLGDIFSGTLVVRERMPVPDAPAAPMPPHLASWAAGLELSGLSDELALTARQYVSRYHELAPRAREEMGHRIASAVAERVTPPPPAETSPPAYLSAVLAERRRRAATGSGGYTYAGETGPDEYGGAQTDSAGPSQRGGEDGHARSLDSGPEQRSPRRPGGFAPPG